MPKNTFEIELRDAIRAYDIIQDRFRTERNNGEIVQTSSNSYEIYGTDLIEEVEITLGEMEIGFTKK